MRALARGEVHVWRASLDTTGGHRTNLLATLSPDERARADRFHFERDREHFIAGRGRLRAILSRYLETAPSAVPFGYDTHGKPRLAGAFRRRLRFNVSHAHGLALYAVSADRELGVDIEWTGRRLEAGIAERFFAPREVATLRALPPHQQRDAFFACWTRKEAYVKARGEGLTLALDQFEVSLAPGEPAALLRVQGDPDEARRWSLQELTPGPGYAAAFAVEGRDWGLQCWDEGNVPEPSR